MHSVSRNLSVSPRVVVFTVGRFKWLKGRAVKRTLAVCPDR